MRTWARLAICGVVGIGIGLGTAIFSVRAGALGMDDRIGAWSTGRDIGTARASAYTRAVVALHGLLALPSSEARYYNAVVDEAGRPLDGKCRYLVRGGALPAKWWSLTLYDANGYLVPNAASVHAIGSVGLADSEAGGWQVMIAPQPQPGHWLPSGGIDRFELTLRAYLPADGGRGNFSAAELPRIFREDCP